MKQLFAGILIAMSLFTVHSAQAQFRKIPGAVTDSFKVKYPNAQSVTWEDRITSFQATFHIDTSKYTARYNSKGEWQNSEKKISPNDVPTAVKDGLSKSKYAEWNKGTTLMRYLPGNEIQYSIVVYKGDFQRRTLVFNPDGRLLKD